jgi:plastocyanin
MRRSVRACVAILMVMVPVSCAPDHDDSGIERSETGAPTVSDGGADVTVAANGITVVVLAIDNNFLAPAITVAAGTEVQFKNNGRNDHDVTPVDGAVAPAWGVTAENFGPKESYSRVFSLPGTYAYYCTIHGLPTAGMIGEIVVTEP